MLHFVPYQSPYQIYQTLLAPANLQFQLKNYLQAVKQYEALFESMRGFDASFKADLAFRCGKANEELWQITTIPHYKNMAKQKTLSWYDAANTFYQSIDASTGTSYASNVRTTIQSFQQLVDAEANTPIFSPESAPSFELKQEAIETETNVSTKKTSASERTSGRKGLNDIQKIMQYVQGLSVNTKNTVKTTAAATEQEEVPKKTKVKKVNPIKSKAIIPMLGSSDSRVGEKTLEETLPPPLVVFEAPVLPEIAKSKKRVKTPPKKQLPVITTVIPEIPEPCIELIELVVPATSTTQSISVEWAKEYLQRADANATNDGNTEATISTYDEFIQACPKNDAAYKEYLYKAYCRKGSLFKAQWENNGGNHRKSFSDAYQQAIENFQKAIEVDREYSEAYYFLGNIARKTENYHDAQRYYDIAYSKRNNLEASKVLEIGNSYLFASAEIDFILKNYTAALAKYRIVIENFDHDVSAGDELSTELKALTYLRCGATYEYMQELTLAKQSYEQALVCDPDSQEARKALAAVSKILSVDESTLNYQNWVKKGVMASAENNHLEAKRCYTKAIEINGDPRVNYPVLMQRIDAYAMLSEYQSVLDETNKLFESHVLDSFSPLLCTLYCKRGYAYIGLKQYKEAKKEFLATKDDVQAPIGLGCIAIEQGKEDVADDYFQNAWDALEKKLAANDHATSKLILKHFLCIKLPKYTSLSYTKLAEIAVCEKQYDDAIIQYETLIAHASFNMLSDKQKAKIHFSCAEVYPKSNRAKKIDISTEYYIKALEHDPILTAASEIVAERMATRLMIEARLRERSRVESQNNPAVSEGSISAAVKSVATSSV